MPVPSLAIPLGSRMPWFAVRSLDGRTFTADGLDPRLPALVMFLCAHSPYVTAIQDHLGATLAPHAGRDLDVVAIASNDQSAYPSDDDAHLRRQAEDARFTFPYCVDDTQDAARAFKASCTPEFYVYDRERRLTYHGEYDDARPGPSCAPTGRYLTRAIDAVVAGAILESDQPPSFGCSIKWRAGAEPSYVLAP